MTSVGVRNSAEINSFNYSPKDQMLFEKNSNIDEINEFMCLDSASSAKLFKDSSNANAHQSLNDQEK